MAHKSLVMRTPTPQKKKKLPDTWMSAHRRCLIKLKNIGLYGGLKVPLSQNTKYVFTLERLVIKTFFFPVLEVLMYCLPSLSGWANL